MSLLLRTHLRYSDVIIVLVLCPGDIAICEFKGGYLVLHSSCHITANLDVLARVSLSTQSAQHISCVLTRTATVWKRQELTS